ncbi:hypothetical protein [Glutamicibacter halophytocola]|uniref:hypothetical protein n=1 Tax=Glutamicibacter halophytocola TaxID=1933880 RepID=UPI0015C55A4A|nr:hypothetical protein [Glutamicibacter halophytocola]NQD40529.1 hypothetical protein [Glutamicibacter halophytocola]
MGYGFYTLPDGREAGYSVEAECDKPGCTTQIDRGLGFLCGESPDGHRDSDEFGCGNYYCDQHETYHDCPNPKCGKYSADESLCCSKAKGHDTPHWDEYEQEAFTETEEDDDA